MFPEQEEVLRRASCLDFSKLKTEILASPSIPEEFKIQSDNLLTQYRRFLVLKVIFGDTSPPLSLSPSAIIDQVWHLHLLTPVHYIKCCKLLGDEVLDHDLAASRDRIELRQKRLEMTKRSYKIAFGVDPPQKFWAIDYQFSPQQDVSEYPSKLDGGKNLKRSHENAFGKELSDNILSKMYRPKILALTYQPSTHKHQRKENHKSESDGEGSQNTESDEENCNSESDEEDSRNPESDEESRNSESDEENYNSESDEEESRNSESDEENCNSESVEEENPNPDNDGEDFINIRVDMGNGDNNLINFKMRRSTKMKNLIDSIEKMGYGKYRSSFRLFFDGGCLNNCDTPESLKMEDGDVIWSLAVQSGC